MTFLSSIKTKFIETLFNEKYFQVAYTVFRLLERQGSIQKGTVLVYRQVQFEYLGNDELRILNPGNAVGERIIRVVNPNSLEQCCTVEILEVANGVVLDFPTRYSV